MLCYVMPPTPMEIGEQLNSLRCLCRYQCTTVRVNYTSSFSTLWNRVNFGMSVSVSLEF